MEIIERYITQLEHLTTSLTTSPVQNTSRLISAISSELSFLRRSSNAKAASCSNAPFFTATGDAALRLSEVYGRDVSCEACLDQDSGGVFEKCEAGGDYEEDDDDDEEEEEGESDEDDPKVPSSNCKEWIQTAGQYPVHFVVPKVVICFTSMTQESEELSDPSNIALVNALELLGVHVVFGIDSLALWIQENCISAASSTQDSLLTDTLNLDLTTLISLVSDTCHRFERIPKHVFDVDALIAQEKAEAEAPLLKELYPLFATRTLVTTRTAFLKFIPIASKIAGPFEKHRIRLLFDPSRTPTDILKLLHEATATTEVSESQVLEWTSAGILISKVGVIEDEPSDRFVRLLTPTPPPTKRKGEKARQQPIKISEPNVFIYGTADRYHGRL
ncbi:hypothetical protein BCR33DRAFT_736744 [Rhizoclosmatium globosum]|uniref:DUF1308 domain-containing protein n=1 Tax=Rhizoclosmatium globosum TaxID=329046 RepID=A0A1Y2CHS6_9FUNG|nr:hypothetical protein BCR33DRAFT_736744 [Rhizoclosmatium globosum]|eukprot:ORY46600.1 hypothetical protein BCR33DRAFT_736744 [Rhizoclosmatium globosum]